MFASFLNIFFFFSFLQRCMIGRDGRDASLRGNFMFISFYYKIHTIIQKY